MSGSRPFVRLWCGADWHKDVDDVEKSNKQCCGRIFGRQNTLSDMEIKQGASLFSGHGSRVAVMCK